MNLWAFTAVLRGLNAAAAGVAALTTHRYYIRREQAEELDGAMHSVWLHGNWRWLTSNMTTEEKEAALAAVVRHNQRIHDDIGDRLNPADWAWWRP